MSLTEKEYREIFKKHYGFSMPNCHVAYEENSIVFAQKSCVYTHKIRFTLKEICKMVNCPHFKKMTYDGNLDKYGIGEETVSFVFELIPEFKKELQDLATKEKLPDSPTLKGKSPQLNEALSQIREEA